MPARLVEGEERAELVRQAVDKLGERQRMALMLSRFENMSYVEIAEAMDLTSKAVKSLLSRARVNLRDALAEYIDMSGAKEIDDETE
jgi:RNA polymerase sigma-70 factor (ECF subfamily)